MQLNFKFQKKVSGKEKEFFSRQMSLMLNAGLPVPRSLEVVERQTRNQYFRRCIDDIGKRVQQGRQLSQAFSHYPKIFSQDYIAVLKSGESTGRLADVFKQLATQQEEENNFRSGVYNALIYPVFVILAIIIIGVYLVFEVIPTISSLFAEQSIQLPWSTRTLIGIVTFINNYWYLILLILIAIIFGARYYFSQTTGKMFLSKMQLSTPVLNDLFTSINVTRFTRTMSMLIGQGVPIIESANIAKKTMGNLIFQRSIDNVVEELERGIPMSKPLLDNKIYPPLVGQMVLVGEQSGKLDEALGNIADHYKVEANTYLKNLSALVEPILIIIVGLGVAFIVFAILLPIYQISQIG